MLRRVPPRREQRTPRVAVITTTAGGAAMVVDPLASRGIEVGAAERGHLCAVRRRRHQGRRASRLIDLTLAGTRYEVMKAALDILTTAPEFDLVVTVVGSSARFYPDLAVRPIIDSAGGAESRSRHSWFRRRRRPAPNSARPASPISTRRKPAPTPSPRRCRAGRRGRSPPACARPARPGAGRSLDELEAYGVLDRLGVAAGAVGRARHRRARRPRCRSHTRWS